MSGENINFNDNEIQKSYFYKNKKINSIEDIDTNKTLVSKKESYGTKKSFKFFIGYNDNNVIRLLCIRLPQMTGYDRKFDENATMSFRVHNKQLLKNYNKIWEKVEKLMKIDFESKPVYDDEYIKTKIKIYAGSIITNFCNKEMPKEKSIMQMFINNNARFCYYPQILLEECKYEQKKIITEKYIDKDLEIMK